MSEGFELGIGILELSCDHLLNSFVSLGHLIFLMAFVPFCGSADSSHSKKVSKEKQVRTFGSIH